MQFGAEIDYGPKLNVGFFIEETFVNKAKIYPMEDSG